jgi:hypothetical protein
MICRVLILLGFLASAAFSQSEVWIKVDSGTVLYLAPAGAEWIPVSKKQKIPAKTYLLSKPGAKAILFQETTAYELPPAAYFFVDDVFHKSRVDLVAALARIEAEQLPVNTRDPGQENRKTLGLIYGEAPEASVSAGPIPFEQERESAVSWFAAHGHYGAALLSLKRAMTKFPALYLRQAHAEQLLSLYGHLELYGFLLEESNRLLALRSSEAFHHVVKEWNDTAKRKLVKLEKQ